MRRYEEAAVLWFTFMGLLLKLLGESSIAQGMIRVMMVRSWRYTE